MVYKNKIYVCHLFYLIFVFGTMLGCLVDSYPVLKGKHLLISASRKPLVNNPELTTLSLGLMEVYLIETLSQHLQFTYEIVPPSDIMSSGYLLSNGSWTGTTGQLQRKEVDMCVTTIPQTAAKSLVMDMSFPVVFVDTAIIIPFPSAKDKWMDTSVFQGKIWVGLLLIFSFMIIATWIIHRITNSRADKSQNSLIYWILFYFGIWSSQGNTTRNTASTFRLAIIFPVFGIYIISNYFTAAYTSVLSIPNFTITIGSIEDLANSGTIKTLLVKGSGADDYMLNSKDPIYQKIGDQMRFHPERRLTNVFKVKDISTVVKDDFALVLIKPNAESLIQTSYLFNNRKCRVTLAEKTFHSQPQGFTYPKGSPIVSVIDNGLLRMHQAGLIQYAERRSIVNHNRCSILQVKNSDAAKQNALKLGDMSGAFVILIAGSLLSFFIFLVELILSKLKKTCDSLSRKN